ncbi:MAG: NF038122 family metalloprotease [Phycisphaerales bacterium]|nr:NF038122 family metalloprotease [Phycisphaerales bacterium]
MQGKTVVVAVSFFAQGTSAQPVVHELPERIVVHQDGTFELQVVEVEPAVVSQAILGTKIPVYTFNNDGELQPGQYYTNNSPSAMRPTKRVAGNVVLNNNGEWTVSDWNYRRSHGTVQPGAVVYIGLESVGIDFIPDSSTQRVAAHAPGPIEIPIILSDIDDTDKPSDISSGDLINSVNRAVNVWEELLRDNNFGPVAMEFFFDPSASEDVLAYAEVITDDRRWNVIYNSVVSTYSSLDSDGVELTVYNWLPSGSTIPFQWDNSSNDDEDDIEMTLPLIRSVFGNSVSTLRIGIRSTADLWDADETDGVDPTRVGLTSVLVHEIGHHMGFDSNTGKVGFPESISMLDVFRFPEDEGPTISASEMQGANRELTENAPAIAGLGINTFDYVFAMSRGGPDPDEGESQASHWDSAYYDPWIPAFEPIGAMTPAFPPGFSLSQFGTYLYQSDIAAFDTIGYIIDQNNLPIPAEEAILQFPGPLASIDPSVDTTFAWVASSNAIGYYIFVDQVMSGGDRNRVFASGVLPSTITSAVVPANTFFAGRNYEWFVTAENGRGIAMTEPAPFDTGDCIADVNNDGQVSPADFSAWINAFNTQSPGCDQNYDGQCSPADFSAWISNFNAGC